MAGITSSGIGSGLDVAGLVTQLVAAERAPIDQRLQRRETKVTTQISALGSLKGALGAFKSALDSLRSADGLRTRTANTGDAAIVTASASTNAVPGTYNLRVMQLAKAQQLSSAAFVGGTSTVVGTGTLRRPVGDASVDLTIDDSKKTLAGIRDAINSASGNPGIQASIVSASDGARLVLTSTKTGAANAIKVAGTGGDGGLAQLDYDAAGTQNLSQLQAAQDAIVMVAGFSVNSATNTVSNAIDGVTLTLKKVDTANDVSLTVDYNRSAVTEKVRKLVTDFNSLQTTVKKLRSYDPATQSAGPMLGDFMLRGVEDAVRRGMYDRVEGLAGDYTTLSSLGIVPSAAGTLEINDAKLSAALTADPDAVAKVFAGESGVASRLFTALDSRLASTGEIESRNANLDRSLKDISAEREALDRRMAIVQARYQKQFTTLDTLMTRMQSTSNYLATQLGSLGG